MAITFNTASSTNGNASSYTFGHNVVGDNRILLVYVGSKGSTVPLVDTITFNTTESLIIATGGNFGDTQTGEMWYLESPTAISGNVVVTLFNSQKAVCGAVSYNGVSGLNTNNVNIILGQNTTPSGSITTQIDNSIVVEAYSQRDATHTPTIDVNYTVRYTEKNTGNPSGGQTEGKGLDRGVGAGLTAGLYTSSHTIGATEAWVVIDAELVEAAGLTPTVTTYGQFY